MLIDIPKDVTANMAEYRQRASSNQGEECVDEVELQAAADMIQEAKAVYLRRRRCGSL